MATSSRITSRPTDGIEIRISRGPSVHRSTASGPPGLANVSACLRASNVRPGAETRSVDTLPSVIEISACGTT